MVIRNWNFINACKQIRIIIIIIIITLNHKIAQGLFALDMMPVNEHLSQCWLIIIVKYTWRRSTVWDGGVWG